MTKAKTFRSWIFVILVIDTIVLAVFELFYLPLRFDGTALPDLGGFPLPITVLIAAVTTPLLVVQAAKLIRLRAGGVLLMLWVFTLLVLSFAGAGGDRVLVEDWRGLLLIIAGLFPAAIALGTVWGKTSKMDLIASGSAHG